jgi:hypothetical protein
VTTSCKPVLRWNACIFATLLQAVGWIRIATDPLCCAGFILRVLDVREGHEAEISKS